MIHGMLAAGAWQDRRGTNLLDGGAPFYGVYPTADGGHMAVGALEQRFYDEFAALLGLSAQEAALRADPDRWEELREVVAARFRGRTREEWNGVFAGTDACVAAVLSLEEAPGHPHLAARGTFTRLRGHRAARSRAALLRHAHGGAPSARGAGCAHCAGGPRLGHPRAPARGAERATGAPRPPEHLGPPDHRDT